MGKILCATRGGEASFRTQEAAIELAKRLGDELLFFIAYDMEFMAHANYALRSDIVAEELSEMSGFLMEMAVERAAQKGVQALYLVRQGPFGEELKAAAQQEKVSLVILGRPGDDPTGEKLTTLEALCRDIKAETRIDCMVLPESEVKNG